MNEKMFEAVLNLVREGGQAAVYIVIIHYSLSLVQYVLGMGILGYAIAKLHSIIRYGIDHSKKYHHHLNQI